MSEAQAENAPEETVLAQEDTEEKEKIDPSESELTLSRDESRNFRYPLDMKAQNHPGTIEFESFIIEGLNISEKITTAFKSLLNSRNSFSNSNDDEESVAAANISDEEKQELIENSQQVTAALATMENLEGGTPNGKVILPLQANIAFNDGAVYQGADLGIIAGGLESAMGSEGSFTMDDGNLSAAGAALAVQKLSGLAGEALGAGAGALGGGIVGAGVGAIAGSNFLEQLPNAVASATRFAPSPNERILFKRVQIRKFSFAFKMVAFSEEEAKEIKNIITFFRTEMYPERVELTTGGDLPLAYKFPNVFKIRIKNRSGANPAYNIQRCYLESIQTNFNATSPTMYKGDYFVEVDIGLNFTEVSALHKKRIRDGY